MLTKNVRPFGAKHAPANSLSPPALRAKANGWPSSPSPTTCDAPSPSSHRNAPPQGEIVTLSGPSKAEPMPNSATSVRLEALKS